MFYSELLTIHTHPHSGYYVLQKNGLFYICGIFLNAWQRSFRYILLPKKHVYSLMPSLDPPTSLHSVQIVSLVHVRFCVNLSISPPHVQSRPGKLNAVCICVWANRDIKEAFYTYTVCGSPMWKSKVIVSNTFTNQMLYH